MRKFSSLAFALSLGIFSPYARPDIGSHERIRSDGSNFILKKILGKVGEHGLRALVVDGEGREQRLLITAEDAVELKRGLWSLRAGDYDAAL